MGRAGTDGAVVDPGRIARRGFSRTRRGLPGPRRSVIVEGVGIGVRRGVHPLLHRLCGRVGMVGCGAQEGLAILTRGLPLLADVAGGGLGRLLGLLAKTVALVRAFAPGFARRLGGFVGGPFSVVPALAAGRQQAGGGKRSDQTGSGHDSGSS